MKNIIAIALTATIASVTGCAVDSGSSDDVQMTEAYQTGLVCDTNTGVDTMKAALAVAVASELGRLDPVNDLEKGSSGVVLSAAGKAQCAARGFDGCPNVSAILGMQNTAVNQFIDQGTFNAVTFREELKASFDRQSNHDRHLSQNLPDQAPLAHELFEVGTSDYGACGIHYDYAAAGDKVENLENRMVFFGGDANPFIDFRSSEGSISIDPTGTMNGDEDADSGMCTDACYAYGSSLRYSCCACEGATGTYQRAPWDSSMVYCAY